jgi:hypothetical protein
MKKAAKPLIAAAALLTMAMVTACGGPSAQPAAAGGGNTASVTSPAATATDTTGNGTAAAKSGTSATTGNNPEETSTTPGTSPPPDSGTTAPAASNEVILGAQFAGGNSVSFGRIIPGQSATLPFNLSNIGGQAVTIVTITTGDEAFSPSAECNGRTMDPGDSCAFSVTFSPAASGDHSSYLEVVVNPGDLSTTGTSLEGSAGSPSVPGQSLNPSASELAPADSSSP